MTTRLFLNLFDSSSVMFCRPVNGSSFLNSFSLSTDESGAFS